jgi:hypothetical protein
MDIGKVIEWAMYIYIIVSVSSVAGSLLKLLVLYILNGVK